VDAIEACWVRMHFEKGSEWKGEGRRVSGASAGLRGKLLELGMFRGG